MATVVCGVVLFGGDARTGKTETLTLNAETLLSADCRF